MTLTATTDLVDLPSGTAGDQPSRLHANGHVSQQEGNRLVL
jgi:hypothetical protein